MLVEDLAKRGGDIGFGVHAVQPACADERCDARPGFGPVVRSGEERILSCQWNRPDRVLDPVGVHFETAVGQEPGEPVPTFQPIPDVPRELAGGGDS